MARGTGHPGAIVAVLSYLSHAGHGAATSRAPAAARGEGESAVVCSNGQWKEEEEEAGWGGFSAGAAAYVAAAVACLRFSAGVVEARARRELAGEGMGSLMSRCRTDYLAC